MLLPVIARKIRCRSGGSSAPSSAPVLSLSSYTDTTIDVSCTSVAGATGYKFYKDGVLVQTQAGTTYQYTGLTEWTSYALTCKASNSAGDSSLSNTVTQKTWFPLGYTGWWKADANVYSDAGTTPAVNNDSVYQWNDQAGTYNAVQATSGNRPLYKTNIQNGLPAILFDGSNDIMASSASVASQARTLVLAYKNVTVIPNGRGMCINTQNGFTTWNQYAQAYHSFYTTSTVNSEFKNTVSSSTSAIIICPCDSANDTLPRINGGAASYTQKYGNNASGTIKFGSDGTSPANCYLFEAFYYPSVLTLAKMQRLEVYLNEKWAIY